MDTTQASTTLRVADDAVLNPHKIHIARFDLGEKGQFSQKDSFNSW